MKTAQKTRAYKKKTVKTASKMPSADRREAISDGLGQRAVVALVAGQEDGRARREESLGEPVRQQARPRGPETASGNVQARPRRKEGRRPAAQAGSRDRH